MYCPYVEIQLLVGSDSPFVNSETGRFREAIVQMLELAMLLTKTFGTTQASRHPKHLRLAMLTGNEEKAASRTEAQGQLWHPSQS